MPKPHIPQPQNVRRITGSFAWIDHRLLRNGRLQAMTHQEMVLYLFLVLAADRHGVSFYRKEKICDLVALDFQQFEVARDRLISAVLCLLAERVLPSAGGGQTESCDPSVGDRSIDKRPVPEVAGWFLNLEQGKRQRHAP
jgi:hypothetical protein